MDEVCFRDKRLGGTLDLFKFINTFELDRNTSVYSAFNYLKARQKLTGKKVRNLYVLCHGLTQSRELDILGHTHKYDYFFSGRIQLGREDLSIHTVANWTYINGLVKNIVVYACMAAHTGRGRQGTIADGQRLMQLLAIATNANVYAAEKSQIYSPDGMMFRKWEGRVFKFSPNGQITQVTGVLVRHLTGKI